MMNYYIILIFLWIAICAIIYSLIGFIREELLTGKDGQKTPYEVDLFQETSIEIPFNVIEANEDLVNALLKRGVLTYDGQYHVAEVADK